MPFIAPELIIQAKQMDLLTYLKNKWPAAFTILAALGDALSVLSPAIKETGFVKTILSFHAMLPFSADGMAWVVPTFLGLVVALIHVKLTGEKPLSLG